MSELAIPIFPIKTVLFPGTMVQLRVLEDRYKALVDAAVTDHHRCFGVALVGAEPGEEGSLHVGSVGTLAVILTLARQDDGGINLLAVGKERFRVVSLDLSGTYPLAVVEELPLRAVASSAVRNLERKARAAATEYFSLLLELNEADSSTFKLPAAAVPLANFIGSNVQISAARRQGLLKFDELHVLLSEEIRLLEDEIRRIRWFETQKRMRPKGPAPFSLN